MNRGVQPLDGGDSAFGVVRQKWRNLQRHPAVEAVGRIVNRTEQIGRPANVVDKQLQE